MSIVANEQKLFNMYFSIKAFKGTKRRFENLDNIEELNEFVANFSDKGFSKFVIKSFDQNGFRFRSFYVMVNGTLVRLLKDQNNGK